MKLHCSLYHLLLILILHISSYGSVQIKSHQDTFDQEQLKDKSIDELEKMGKQYDTKGEQLNSKASAAMKKEQSASTSKSLPSRAIPGQNNPDLTINTQNSIDADTLFNSNIQALNALKLSKNLIQTFILNLLKPKHFLRGPTFAKNIISSNSRLIDSTLTSNSTSLGVSMLNSQPFTDFDNLPGRHGGLTLIDDASAPGFKHVRTVVNNKVIVFYENGRKLNIVKILRLSQVMLFDDLHMSPCFSGGNKKIRKPFLVCAGDYKEKEEWLNIIKRYAK